MAKQIMVIAAVVLVVLLLIGTVIFWRHTQRQGRLSECKQACFYIPAHPQSGGRLVTDSGNYWAYESRKFETQNQCAEYCSSK